MLMPFTDTHTSNNMAGTIKERRGSHSPDSKKRVTNNGRSRRLNIWIIMISHKTELQCAHDLAIVVREKSALTTTQNNTKSEEFFVIFYKT